MANIHWMTSKFPQRDWFFWSTRARLAADTLGICFYIYSYAMREPHENNNNKILCVNKSRKKVIAAVRSERKKKCLVCQLIDARIYVYMFSEEVEELPSFESDCHSMLYIVS